MDNLVTCTAIADAARVLYYAYPLAADNLQRARLVLDVTHDADARECYGEWNRICRDWSIRLGELALAVAERFPELWSKLRLVAVGGLWHDQPRFDWAAAVAELRSIESAALSERHQAGEDLTKATGWDAATEARNKWIYDEATKGTAWSTIKTKLGKKPKTWPRLESVNGIKKAALAYATRFNLPTPPDRQPGRRKGS